MWTTAEKGPAARAGEVLTQHGDVCVLRLLEALLQTLPHLLLQAYVVVAVDPAGFVPGERGVPGKMLQLAEGRCFWVGDACAHLGGWRAGSEWRNVLQRGWKAPVQSRREKWGLQICCGRTRRSL